jgi:hypothetical protein
MATKKLVKSPATPPPKGGTGTTVNAPSTRGNIITSPATNMTGKKGT